MSERQVIRGRFEIADPERDLLGRGGMGDVYRGRDLHTGDRVAIKVLRPEVVAGVPDAIARFIREGEALRELDHHNIVKMVDAVKEKDRHYLVMEYVTGGSLRDVLEEQGRLPIERTVEIALDIADALTRAHRLGIIHRDLKPSNVLLAEDGTPRLTDFGHAHLSARPRLTQAGTVVGTVFYLSPEACQGETLDARADIWAFGVMLYEMLTGDPPFDGETFPTVLTALLTQQVPDLSQVCPGAPDALVDLVYRMLEKDRSARVPSVRLVGAELEAIAEGSRLNVEGWQTRSQQRPSTTTSRFAIPTSAAWGPKHNLPIQPTPFVGREAELVELDGLLSDPEVRLVTVLGAGGMGKTRLALQATEAQLNRFIDGAYFVSLAPLQSADAIVPTIAEALGFAFYEGGAPRQQLLNYLREKRMLLLLDNCEHLLVGVDIVADVLGTTANVKVLSTSRARLNVQGEHLFRLSGMEFPDWETPEDAAQYNAVKLFLQSARRVRPGFELQMDDLKYISRICRLVGGMPLGILLAAGWVEMLTPEEIAAEIERSLDLLRTGLRDLPERQRSMRAVYNHSWNLLTERDQKVFAGLSVFRGGFDRQAAQQVTGASLWELRSFVDRSLLHRTPVGRYEMHELLRQYAADRLAQQADRGETTRDRHSAYYMAALERWDADLKGPRQRTALAETNLEIQNARTAWDWAAERGRVERLTRALDGLCWFYYQGRCQEGKAVCCALVTSLAAADRPGLAATPGRLRLWVSALGWQSAFARRLGHIKLAGQLLRQGQALLDRPELADQDTRAERARVLYEMGRHKHDVDSYEEARQLLKQSLA